MSEITANFRAVIISLMIVSGAINTIGNSPLTQPTSSRTNRWSTKDSTTSTSSIPTCKYPAPHSGSHHVLRRSTRTRHLLPHEKTRRRRIQNAHARGQIQGQRSQPQRLPARHPCDQRPDHFHSAVRGPQLRGGLSLPDDEGRVDRHHLHLLDGVSENEGQEEPSGR